MGGNPVGFKSTCPDQLKQRIMTSGIGYMANTSRRGDLNIKIRAVYPSEVGTATIFFIATKLIQRGNEIFSPYNNVESRQLLLIRENVSRRLAL